MLRPRPEPRYVPDTSATVLHVMREGKTINQLKTASMLTGGALVTLVLQNSALALVMWRTRASGQPESMYIPTTAVIMAETFKLAVALCMQRKMEGSIAQVVRSIRANTIEQPEQYLKMGVLALLYTIQNNLSYVAVSHLDGPTYQVICQSKILITALLSVALLNRSLTRGQWVSLTLLAIGVGMVQLSAEVVGDKTRANTAIGFASAIALCLCSSLAGVLFELILKGTAATSLWMRNIQLGSFSLFIGLGALVLKDGAEVANRGFFSGYSFMVWLCVSLHSLGGVAVAMVIKYADNLAKCFATSISISLTCFISNALLDMNLNRKFVTGAIMVMCATYLYNANGTGPKVSTYASLQRAKSRDGEGREDERNPV